MQIIGLYNCKEIGEVHIPKDAILNASIIIKNVHPNELNSSTRPTSFQKMKYRKDAKGNLILKKKMAIKRTKHHVYFMDDINKKKPLVTTIEIESYKKYNLEGDEEIQEETVKEEDKQPLGETQVVKSNGCCCIL